MSESEELRRVSNPCRSVESEDRISLSSRSPQQLPRRRRLVNFLPSFLLPFVVFNTSAQSVVGRLHKNPTPIYTHPNSYLPHRPTLKHLATQSALLSRVLSDPLSSPGGCCAANEKWESGSAGVRACVRACALWVFPSSGLSGWVVRSWFLSRLVSSQIADAVRCVFTPCVRRGDGGGGVCEINNPRPN